MKKVKWIGQDVVLREAYGVDIDVKVLDMDAQGVTVTFEEETGTSCAFMPWHSVHGLKKRAVKT